MPNIHRLLEVFRADHLRVVYLTLGPVLADGSDLSPTFRWRYRLEEQSLGFRVTYPLGTPGHRILDEIAPRPDELVINKTANSAFNASDIDRVLRNLEVRTLIAVHHRPGRLCYAGRMLTRCGAARLRQVVW